MFITQSFLLSSIISLRLFAAAAFPLAITLTLGADVITKHRSEDEILLGRELVQWSCNHQTDSVKALLAPEKEVHPVVAHGLDDIADVLFLQTRGGIILILLVESEQHHTAHALLKLVDMIHQHLHVGWHNLSNHPSSFSFVRQAKLN